ncbi:hypothetical protein E2C01_004051 [Portunus trituberculatus]|uniref:Ig-like domain-containing protein n=1 Tax=Portunus trituberculatus TaxID=210409 RepID=A0A5B7CQI1_PORTR|nr:hypothetical protein [Portunus trituberculatus]
MLYWIILLLCIVYRETAGDKRKDRAPLPFSEGERQYRLSRRPIRRQAVAPEGTPWMCEDIPPTDDRILGWAINDHDAYFASDRKGWDYGVSESVREALADKGLDQYDDDVCQHKEEGWAQDDPLTQFLREEDQELTRDLRNYLEKMNERKDSYEDDDDDDEAEDAKRIKEEEDRKRKVMYEYFNDIGGKDSIPLPKMDRVTYLIEYWGKRKMSQHYKRRMQKVMDHNHYLRELQQKALYFLLGKQPHTALVTGRISFSPEYVLHNNLDRLVLHLQFYIYLLKKDRNNIVICEITEVAEGSRNSLSVWLTDSFLFVKFSLKGVEGQRSYPIRQPVLLDWYHVRVVAMQTKVTVTVTCPVLREAAVTFPLNYLPVLAFGNMVVSVGSPNIRAYVMGLAVNNRLLDWTQAAYHGHQVRMVHSQFMFQPAVHLSGKSEYYAVHCNSTYRLQHIDHIEIDLPVARPPVRDRKPHVLVFGPTSEDTGWALVAVEGKWSIKQSWNLQFCTDWLNKKTCLTAKRVVFYNHTKLVLRITWRKPQRSFTVETLEMKSLYMKQVLRYKADLPKCSSKIFIGGVDAAWRHKLVASKRPVSNLRASLTRVVINKFNIQLNAMVPESQDKQNYAILLNRGQRASSTRLGSLPPSPVFISAPVLGNETRTLSCSYDSINWHTFFGRANFTAFWIDQHGNYMAEEKGSEKSSFTELSVGGDRVDNLYACVIRIEGVLDMVPVTYAVFRVDVEYPHATVNTFTAHLRGTAICRGARVSMCQTYKNIEEVEFIEIQDWYNFIPYTLNVMFQKLVVPLHSGDFADLKMALWMFVFFHFVIVFLFVALPNNNDHFHGATSRINKFLANHIFPFRLSYVQELLLMGERRRPYPYRPKQGPYHFAEKEAFFSAPMKMLLQQCKLLEPPDPKKQLIGHMLWTCLEAGQLDAIEAQDIIMYFNILHQRRQPVITGGYVIWRDDWLEARYGKQVQFDDAKLDKQYRHLNLEGGELRIKGHLESQVVDMYVHSQLKPCLDHLEDIYRKATAKHITPNVRRNLKYRAWTVSMAVRVFLYYQKLPKFQRRPSFRRLPYYDQTKLYEHRQVAWVLMKHVNTILVQFDRVPEHKMRKRMYLILRKLFMDLQELRVRRYRTFLRHRHGLSAPKAN